MKPVGKIGITPKIQKILKLLFINIAHVNNRCKDVIYINKKFVWSNLNRRKIKVEKKHAFSLYLPKKSPSGVM